MKHTGIAKSVVYRATPSGKVYCVVVFVGGASFLLPGDADVVEGQTVTVEVEG